jgi:threonine dehydrogenase-like Zn-dependent dehydrogenase
MSVVVKAIEESLLIQTTRLPGSDPKTWLRGKRALVAGLGPIGLLSAFVLKLRGAELWGLDIVDESSSRPSIFKEIGGKYINGRTVKTEKIDDQFGKMDFIFEATGIASLELQLMDALGMNGIYVLTGIPSGDRPVCVLGAELMQKMVLMNQIMLGSVNAGKTHYLQAVDELIEIKNRFGNTINKLITERTNFSSFRDVLDLHSPDEIKAVVEWSD